MDGILLRIFTTEKHRHGGELLYEWLLEQAKKLGIRGGSAVRAFAGYGRHGRLHEEAFYELAGDLPVEVIFFLSQEELQRFLEHLDAEKLSLFYVTSPAQSGLTAG